MSSDKNKRLITKELLILADKNDQIVGYDTKEKCHQGEGLLHRAFSIFIFNDHKQVLMQKRSTEKLLWPFYWSNSVCSHPRKGERYEEAAIRRLNEELGFETSLQFLFKFQYQAQFKNIGSENEICSVYIGKANGTVQANPSEIAEWKYSDIRELTEDVQAHPHRYTPWFKMEWEEIQTRFCPQIENLYV
ncbi:isopentenyl-diphosphate Delta-isomerase [Desulfonema magnum]|uniref:Isopentenyl-diphosphate delta-isomerase n=1 Tax=Desulfonema magnum TaxID=45655 RepID=A0A975GPR2_9BACT|nr:isopentenyl-diphosphate Delta-isomerase [Desulfonema magnum]QTA88168.1 Isopentenyl-diphosphate Delta-isomerase [Desulfonema magnum]